MVILFAHVSIVGLYLTGNAVSTVVPFSNNQARTLITSDLVPSAHAIAAFALLYAIITHRWSGPAACISFFVWICTTIILFLGSHDRIPPLAYWSATLSLTISLAAFLMLVRWGVDKDGDDSGGA